jgi:hypothetical protein
MPEAARWITVDYAGTRPERLFSQAVSAFAEADMTRMPLSGLAMGSGMASLAC